MSYPIEIRMARPDDGEPYFWLVVTDPHNHETLLVSETYTRRAHAQEMAEKLSDAGLHHRGT